MQHQHCKNFPDIAQWKSQANTEQKDKIVQNIYINKCIFYVKILLWKKKIVNRKAEFNME